MSGLVAFKYDLSYIFEHLGTNDSVSLCFLTTAVLVLELLKSQFIKKMIELFFLITQSKKNPI